jgi:hypothetical protein
MMRPASNTLSTTFLSNLPHSHVLVLPGQPEGDGDLLIAAWKAARDDAARAYELWRDGTGHDAFAVYRAAADREDAAAAALATRARMRRTRWFRLLIGDGR